MKNTAIIRNFWFGGFVLLLLFAANSSAQVIRQAKSLTPANLDFMATIFRQDLGGANNGAGNSYTSGYREIDWEDLPAGGLGLQGLFNYYNTVSPRGIILNPVQRTFTDYAINYSRDGFQEYGGGFQAYSGNTIFSPVALNHLDISFVIPGTNIPASVKGFGAFFSDIDQSGMTWICLYDEKGELMETLLPQEMNGGMTFIGASYSDGRRIARVSMRVGNTPLPAGTSESWQVDKTAMDNIIYGEPRAIGHHPSDFDGDGTTDAAVFRPSDGKWYVMQSGTNTFSVVPFGLQGDIPVDGDFDGDSRSDYAVFRPSTATWWVLRSSDLGAQASQFGLSGDKPVAGDYDKDGKTDYAVWRDGMYWILQSSNGAGVGRQFGLPGDIPIGAALQ